MIFWKLKLLRMRHKRCSIDMIACRNPTWCSFLTLHCPFIYIFGLLDFSTLYIFSEIEVTQRANVKFILSARGDKQPSHTHTYILRFGVTLWNKYSISWELFYEPGKDASKITPTCALYSGGSAPWSMGNQQIGVAIDWLVPSRDLSVSLSPIALIVSHSSLLQFGASARSADFLRATIRNNKTASASRSWAVATGRRIARASRSTSSGESDVCNRK